MAKATLTEIEDKLKLFRHIIGIACPETANLVCISVDGWAEVTLQVDSDQYAATIERMKLIGATISQHGMHPLSEWCRVTSGSLSFVLC